MQQGSHVQVIRFPRKYWSRGEAAEWVESHGFEPIKVTAERGRWNFRLEDPSHFDHFATKVVHSQHGLPGQRGFRGFAPNAGRPIDLVIGFRRPRVEAEGGVFSDEAKRSLAEYQQFRHEFARQFPGSSREQLSAAWRERKIAKQRLQASMIDLESDPRSLHKELLAISQASPNCYPYGLSLQELGDIDKLRQAVRRARRLKVIN